MKKFFALLSLLIIGIAALLVGVLWVFWTYGRDLPDYRQLAQYEPDVVSRVYAGNGALLEEFATQKRLFVPTQAMPPQLINAFLSAEDKGFYDHFAQLHSLDVIFSVHTSHILTDIVRITSTVNRIKGV